MQLPIFIQTDSFKMTATAPTVIQPGEEMAVTTELLAAAKVTIDQILWEIPEGLSLRPADEPGDLPVTLNAGDNRRFKQVFISEPERESYGEIRGQIVFHPGDGTEAVTAGWTHWASIFQQVKADETEALSDELRSRLIGVTNARPQNGHIFLADHIRYFADYLHILIPERLAAALSREFGLSGQGLPADEEQYLLFAQGLRTFYGIEVLELIAEEDCNESDDRLDLEGLREAAPSDVELNI